MNNITLLDILFATCGVLLLPIGFLRGALREVFVTAGVLAGATLSASWARPWGADLSTVINVRLGVAQFIVSAAFILGCALVLGYGGSAAAHLDRPELRGRVAGAMLAAINGALVSAYMLRGIEDFLADPGTERSLKASVIAWTLLRQFGWVGLSAALVMAGAILLGLVEGDRQSLTNSSPGLAGGGVWTRASLAPGRRKRRLGWGEDAGKVEPVATAFDPLTGRGEVAGSHHAGMMTMAPVDAARWSMDRAGGRPEPGTEWIQIAAAGEPKTGTPFEPSITSASGGDTGRCKGCGESLTPMDAFCPRCGRGQGNN